MPHAKDLTTVPSGLFTTGRLVRLAGLTLIGLFASCGEQASFDDRRDSEARRAGDNATVAGNDGADGVDGIDANGEGGDAGGADAGGEGGGGQDAADGATDGVDSADGSGVDGATDGDEDTPNGQPGDEDLLIEDGGSLDLPGIKALRVGVNFEDATDMDHNDAVLCFEGLFKVDDTNVVSYANQTVKASTFSASGCKHRIDVKIMHEDGSSTALNYRSNSGQILDLPFKIKSRLEVTMTTLEGGCDTTPVSMHTKPDVIVQPNVCNQTGN